METTQAKRIIGQIGQEKQASLQGGGNDFRGLLKRLVGIWNNPSHALIELLQNADDTDDATTVKYKIHPNGILFEHNGHPFKAKEVRAICSIDDSTKDAEKHTGFMGIGFKAVFKLSTSPFIFSPPWQFRFSPDGFPIDDWGWILIPRWVDTIPAEIGGVQKGKTVFWLPYKEELSEDSKRRIAEALFDQFDSLCLLFLRNVTQIQIENSDGIIRKLHLDGDAVIEEKNGQETTHRYKVFRKQFKVPDDVKAEYQVQESGRDKAKVREIVLAFALDSKNNLQSLKDSHLYTFLPMDYDPNLRFVVQGDFILDSQRSSVDESLKWNQWLWSCVRDLLQSSIEGFIDDEGNHVKGFKDDEKMRYQFYSVLPSKGDYYWSPRGYRTIVQTELVEPFWKYCQETPIIVTSDNVWVKPEEAAIANSEVQNLLDREKLKELTEGEHFVHPEVQGVKEFLTEMGVDALEEQKILEALEDENWVNSKESGWFHDLYAFLWGRLFDVKKWTKEWVSIRYKIGNLNLPIVKTSQGIAKKPDEVLFPPESEKELELATGIPSIFFVDTSILEDNSHKLLEKLGVQSFSQEGIIKTVILKGFEDGTWQNWDVEVKDKCVKFIREWLKGQEWKTPTDLGVVRIWTEDNTLERANKCYFPEQELKMLYPEANFVRQHKEDEEEHAFLRALGVKDSPRLLLEEGKYQSNGNPAFALHWKEYWDWLLRDWMPYSTGYRRVSNITCFDSWDELQWSSGTTKLLLNYLITHWSSYYKQHLESRYEYFNRGAKGDNVPSYFAWQLWETKWLPTTKGLMKPSAEVFVPSTKIKRVAGDFIPYLSIPEGRKEQEFLSQGQEFLVEFLGLSTELDIEALKYILSVAQRHPVDDNLKHYLPRVYKALGRRLEEENECELGKLKLPTEAWIFEESTSLYWNDDHDLGTLFQGKEGVSFAWIPENVERGLIEVLFERAGVKALSKCVRRDLITPTNVELNEDMTNLLQGKARYIYSLLKHHKAVKANIAGEKLSRIQVKSSDKLDVLLRLDEIRTTFSANVFYDVDSDTIYLTKDVENFEIPQELARVFVLDLSYSSDIEIILQEENEQVEKRFQRQGIALLKWSPQPVPDVKSEEVYPPESKIPEVGGDLRISGAGRTPQRPYIPPKPSRQVERVGLPYEERMKVESSNIERIIKFEDEKYHRKAANVSKEYKGYDLESTDEVTGDVHYIEVKAPGYVTLTPHEYKVAKEKGSSYYLYIAGGDVMYIIHDPTNSCDIEEIETLETRWKILRWKENAQKYEL